LVAVLVGERVGSAALDAANGVLATAGGVHGLARLTADELAEATGIDRAAAGRLLAAIELGRRTLRCPPGVRPQVLNAEAVGLLLLPEYGGHPVERFGVVLLDARHRLIRTQLLTVGALDASIVRPREIFRAAALAGAAAVVAFHNHPSGDVSPSAEDLELTTRLVRAGELLGIDVVDHVILGDTQYCSLREAGHNAWRG
jgi:DNA repair protein RadC